MSMELLNAGLLSDLLAGALGALCIVILVASLWKTNQARKQPPQSGRARVAVLAGRAFLIRTGRRDWRSKPHYHVRFELEGGSVDLLCPVEIYARLEEGQWGLLTYKMGRVMSFEPQQS